MQTLLEKMVRDEAVRAVLLERDRQNAKWGFPQQNTFAEWACILAEEFGELANELNELHFRKGDREKMVEEATHVAAVAISIIEHYNVSKRLKDKRPVDAEFDPAWLFDRKDKRVDG